ncbi:MAG: Smr/MutS family protein [Clostridiales bacterium]|mgnify:CR=1 FL=1|jgi:DNA-nicking Smr family endonuclease|nr:Smr/MutS family protein [Clostridiales bacterium]
MNAGFLEIDLHGKNKYQARVAIDAALRRSSGVYRIRLIHGFNAGTALRDMIQEEYLDHPKILRLISTSSGVTELVLREL